MADCFPIRVFRGEGDRQQTSPWDQEVGGLILIPKGMAGHDNRLGPAGHQTRYILTNDRLAKDGAVQNVPDRAIGRAPHLLEFEFFHPLLVGGDRRAFHANAILFDRIRGIDGDLIIRLVALFNAEIIVFQIDIKIGQDQFGLDKVPDDPGHFIAIKFYNRFSDLNLRHAWGSPQRQ